MSAMGRNQTQAANGAYRWKLPMTRHRNVGTSTFVFAAMDAFYIERMKSRLLNMRKVAALSHDPRIIKLVTETADQLEEDINRLEAESSVGTKIHIAPPSRG